MSEHPIEGLMLTAMSSIQDMVDVNTIIGEPIEAANNIIIIPISKVSFGFAAGGSEFKGETVDEYTKKDKEEAIQYRLPFGGGSGAGVSINPIAFLVVQENNVKLLPVNHTSAIDKLLDYIPDLIEKSNEAINKCMQNKKETTEKIIQGMKNKNNTPKEIEESEKEVKEQVRKNKTNISKKVGENEIEYNEANKINITNDIDYEDY